MKPANDQVEFQARYAYLLDQYDPLPENGFPDFEGMKTFVKAELEDEDASSWHQALSDFANFEAFYNWLDTLTAYEAMDAGDSLFDDKPLLEVVYHALLSEKPESATVAAGSQEAQDEKVLPKIVGFQVHTQDGNHYWRDRAFYLTLTEGTAIRDLIDARKGQGHQTMTAILGDADAAKRNWPLGVTFVNLKDETDTDEHGKERITPKGNTWVVTDASGAGDNWLLSCEASGASIIPSSFDLRNDFAES